MIQYKIRHIWLLGIRDVLLHPRSCSCPRCPSSENAWLCQGRRVDIVTTSFAPNQWRNLCCNIGCGFIYVELKKLNHKCISQLDKNTPIFEKGGAHCFAHVSWLSVSNNIKLNKCPPPFQSFKGSSGYALGLQNKGSRYQPGTRSFKFSDCVSLVLFLCVIQFGRENGGGWCYKCPLPKHLANDICHSTYIFKSDGKISSY